MSWDPINLAKIEPRPAIGPTVGDSGLVYPGRRHVFSGLPESAKTLAAYAVILEVVRAGGNVLLIDFEMGQWEARDRLREMGATDADLERVFYIEPDRPATPEIVEHLVETWAFDLVVVDAAAGAYSLQELDDNSRSDAEKFTRLYVNAFWTRGVATIVLDHVSKNAKSRGTFAIGSERKVGGADVHLGFETVLPIARGGRGLYKVITHKDRFGHLPRPKAAELELRSDPITHALSWTFKPPEVADPEHPWQPTHLMEKVSRWLEMQADAVTRNEVERNVPGTAEYVRHALDALILEKYVQETAGPRRSRLVHSLRPYRESTASDYVGTASGRSQDEPVATASESSGPLGTDADAVAVVGLFEKCVSCGAPLGRGTGNTGSRCAKCARERRAAS